MKNVTHCTALIRPAERRDVARIANLVELFFLESGYARLGASFCWSSTWAIIDRIVEGNTPGICLLAIQDDVEVGFILSIIYPLWFMNAHLSSHELAWWVHSSYRRTGVGRELYSQYEKELVNRKVSSSAMVTLECLRPKETGEFYESKGYTLSECVFHKRMPA